MIQSYYVANYILGYNLHLAFKKIIKNGLIGNSKRRNYIKAV